jgi:hypothetical protein
MKSDLVQTLIHQLAERHAAPLPQLSDRVTELEAKVNTNRTPHA